MNTTRCNHRAGRCVHGPQGPSLHDALLAAGYRHEPGEGSARDIIRISDGVVVGRMKAHEAWEWLRSQTTTGKETAR